MEAAYTATWEFKLKHQASHTELCPTSHNISAGIKPSSEQPIEIQHKIQ